MRRLLIMWVEYVNPIARKEADYRLVSLSSNLHSSLESVIYILLFWSFHMCGEHMTRVLVVEIIIINHGQNLYQRYFNPKTYLSYLMQVIKINLHFFSSLLYSTHLYADGCVYSMSPFVFFIRGRDTVTDKRLNHMNTSSTSSKSNDGEAKKVFDSEHLSKTRTNMFCLF
jgi:hypothetical protein